MPEESFKFTKTCLGWEEVQLLDLTGIRNLVALAWVAAGPLYELGITLEWAEVQLLALLGGWVARKDNKPGKIVLTRGLRRLLDCWSPSNCWPTAKPNTAAYHRVSPPGSAVRYRRIYDQGQLFERKGYLHGEIYSTLAV